VDVDADYQAAFMDCFNKCEEISPKSMALVDWTNIAQKKVSYSTPQTHRS
jgi:hypothetical protein